MYSIKEILNWLENYKNTTKCKGVVIGISGGKDSTTVAMLAKKVWGENVIGLLLPNGEQVDIEDSKEIVKTLNINYQIININNIVSAIEKQTLPDPKTKTNIPPRVRMTIEYAIAQKNGYRVIGTGNRSESFIGWSTKFGDSAYDFNPIAHLTCTEVVCLGLELAKRFNLRKDLITKKPADGLTGKTDEDNFGFTYEQLDKFILSGTSGDIEIDKKIAYLHENSKHKRSEPPHL